MNQMLKLKSEQLKKNISSIEQQLLSAQIPKNDEELRRLIDSRRYCLAQLKTLSNNKLIEAAEPTCYQSNNREAEHFVKMWCSRLADAPPTQVSFKSQEFCQLFLDQALPLRWHFDNDIVVVISPPSTDIVNILKNRGQKNIVVYFQDEAPKSFLADLRTIEGVHICLKIYDLEKTFALLQSPATQVIKISCDDKQLRPEQTDTIIADAINNGKRTRFENTRTASRFGRSWAKNVIENLHVIANSKNIHSLSVKGVEDAVVVASGPSLNKNVQKLQEIQDKVFIVTALRSLPVLDAFGINPDLVIQLDAEDDDVARELVPNRERPIKNFLVELIVNPGFLKIPAEQTIWSLAQHFYDIHQHFGTKPTQFNVPSVSIYALCLCHALKFKNIAFVGQDLAADGDKQYADGATTLLPAHAKMSMFNIEVPGFYGGPVMTRNSFEYQIRRCSELANDWKTVQPELNLVNATEGGAYIDGFDHMSLQSFAEAQNIFEKDTEKAVHFHTDDHIADQDVKFYFSRIEGVLDQIKYLADTIIKLDKKLDKTRGLNKKIQKNVDKFKKLNQSTSLLLIAMQERISRVIGTSADGQKIDTYSEFFANVKDYACMLNDATKRQRQK